MTVDDFFTSIDAILNSSKFKDCSYPVFRGHSHESYELVPTLIREYKKTGLDVWHLENNLYNDFKALAGPRLKFNSSWEMLFTMRHEGIPTRLLDWTENIGTALFFAIDSTYDNPHLWVLNPFELNKKNPDLKGTLADPEEDLKPYHDTYASYTNNSSLVTHDLPLTIYPRRSNERIFAQRGLFTIHGLKEDKLEDNCLDCIEKIIIPIDIIDKLKNLLKQFGINKYSVYPDLTGLAEHLKEIHKY